MPANSFVGGATGDPKDHRLRIAPQDAQDIDDFPALIDTRDNGTDIGYQHQSVDPQKVTPGGIPTARIDGKTPLDGFTLRHGDVDPGDKLLLLALANVFGEYDLATASSRSRWRFGIGEGTDADEFLKLSLFDGVNPAWRVLNAKLGGFDLTAGPNQNLALTFPGLASRFDFFEVPSQVAGSGSDLPTIHGTLPAYSHDVDDATPDSVFVEVQSVTSGVAVCKATIATRASSPAYAGSNTFSVTLGGHPVEMIDEATGLSLSGDPGAPLEIQWPEGATLTASDEFEIETRVDSPWSPSYATKRILPSRNVRLIVNDLPIRLEGGFSLAVRWSDFSLQSDTPGAQGGTVKRAGELTATLTVTREIRDLVFEQLRMNRGRVPVVVDVVSKTIIPSATNLPYRFGVVLPSVGVDGPSFRNNAGATNTQEAPQLVAAEPDSAYSYDGRSWSSHCHVFVDTGISAYE